MYKWGHVFLFIKGGLFGLVIIDQEAHSEAQNGKQCGRQLCHMASWWCLCPVSPLGCR